ncbi:hypothetical protein ACIRON_18045 [Nocardioides sp. NPDC101246]|uniref:hypothetical protein n=1 Tax=Nocardioides sp. NPDC101246 TaxID=3364336 RepID=UPI003820338E
MSLGAETYRVVQPAKTLAHASLHDGYHGWHLSADRRASLDLAAAWWLAARSRHSLIYLPLRSSPALCGQEYNGGRLDLVLLHHSLAFPVSRWKRVRGGLGKGRPHKITLPEGGFPRFSVEEHRQEFHREFRDRLDWRVAADTLFVVGSQRAFELRANEIRRFAEECPAHLHENPQTHCCAEIDIGDRWRYRAKRNAQSELHIQACNEHW